MKIAILTNNVFKFGGQERVVSVLANELVKENEVTIICTELDDNCENIYNLDKKINIVNFNHSLKKFNVKRLFYKFLKIINNKTNLFKNNIRLLTKIYLKRDKKFNSELVKLINNNYDIVIGVAGKYSLHLGFLKDQISSNVKLVGWQHNCFDAYFNTKEKYYWHQKSIFKKYLPKLDGYVVLTNFDKKNIDYNFNINSVVINNPLSFNSEKKSLLKEKVFLSLGRLEDAKGYDLLLESFRIYSKLESDWKLRIVGNGSKKDFIIKKIKEYQLEDRVELYPFTKDVISQMLNSSIFLFPSRWEGFGLVVTEAFECGLPVISYKLEPVCEIINDEENGLLIDKFNVDDFANQMYDLVNNIPKMQKLSKNAIKKAENYSSKKIIEVWKKFLGSL